MFLCWDSIWIIGSSIIHWAHIYAKSLNQDHFGQESSNILWHGIRVMFWEQLYPTIVFLLDSNKAPKIIIIHCGSNNIGQVFKNFSMQLCQILLNYSLKLVLYGYIFSLVIIGWIALQTQKEKGVDAWCIS